MEAIHTNSFLVELDGIPEPPDWSTWTRGLKTPTYCVHIAYPCCGIVGSQHATASLVTQACDVYDLEPAYEQILNHIFRNCPTRPILHLGQSHGDLLTVPLRELTCPDIVVSGPPCPPWAGHGNKLSSKDSRAAVYTTVLKWIAHFIQCGSLKIAIVENVAGIMKCWSGRASFMDNVLATLKAECDTFHWDVVRLSALDYRLPQERNRVWLLKNSEIF